MVPKIKQILADVLEESSLPNVNDNTDIVNELGLNSLQMINFILSIEDEFDVEIDFAEFDFAHLSSINRFADFISESKNVAI